jgi:hypothetical protein
VGGGGTKIGYIKAGGIYSNLHFKVLECIKEFRGIILGMKHRNAQPSPRHSHFHASHGKSIPCHMAKGTYFILPVYHILRPVSPLLGPQSRALVLSLRLRCTMLQAGCPRVRLPTRSIDFSIDLILPAALWPWDRPSL